MVPKSHRKRKCTSDHRPTSLPRPKRARAEPSAKQRDAKRVSYGRETRSKESEDERHVERDESDSDRPKIEEKMIHGKLHRNATRVENAGRRLEDCELEQRDTNCWPYSEGKAKKPKTIRSRLVIRKELVIKEEFELADSPANAGPSIPDPFDDRPRLVTTTYWKKVEKQPRQSKREKRARVMHKLKKQIQSKELAQEEQDLQEGQELQEAQEEQESQKENQPATFLTLPPEIRLEIYRYLLLHPSSIRVHGSWTLTYKRQQLNLCRDVLRVCQLVHREAIAVLYGENTFKYVLRDPSSVILYHQGFATDNDKRREDIEDETESEWEDISNSRKNAEGRRRSGLRGPKDREIDIYLNSYIGYFRSISIEAEQNRYHDDTLNHMVHAVMVFSPQPRPLDGLFRKYIDKIVGLQPDPLAAWKRPQWHIPKLQKISLRVTPQAVPQLDDNVPNEYTFANFFHKNSALIGAIKSTPCSILQIQLLNPTTASTERSNAAARVGCNLILPMYQTHTPPHKGAKSDPWKWDCVAMTTRKLRKERVNSALLNLQDHIIRLCGEDRFGERRYVPLGEYQWGSWVDEHDAYGEE